MYLTLAVESYIDYKKKKKYIKKKQNSLTMDHLAA